MRRLRLIPVLLLDGNRLVKTVKFKSPMYVGDPINAVKIFNDKEVDELVLLDISAGREGRSPLKTILVDICSEAFMPLAYGGGINSVDDAMMLLQIGFEKVVLNSAAVNNPQLISQLSKLVGSQSVVVSVDFKKTLFQGCKCYIKNGKVSSGYDPVEFCRKVESLGAGEIILNSIDRDGTYQGLDLEITGKVVEAVSIPVIACGGLNSLENAVHAINKGASAVAGGSFFVYKRPHNAVLLSYPPPTYLEF